MRRTDSRFAQDAVVLPTSFKLGDACGAETLCPFSKKNGLAAPFQNYKLWSGGEACGRFQLR